MPAHAGAKSGSIAAAFLNCSSAGMMLAPRRYSSARPLRYVSYAAMLAVRRSTKRSPDEDSVTFIRSATPRAISSCTSKMSEISRS